MNKRLLAIAKNVHNGKGLIDVGTDHGYLPVYLAENNYTGHLFASDINEGPLQSAVRSSQEAGVENRITFLLCNGLERCDPALIDTVVIAGMGGDVISGILDKADWLLAGDYELILQPMTKAEVLRYWLINNGFMILNEQLAEDSGHVYQILVSRAGKSPTYSEAELYIGKYEMIRKEKLFLKKLDKQIASFEKNLAGLNSSDKPAFEARRKLTAEICSQLLELRKRFTEDQQMIYCGDIFSYLCELAPTELQMDFDNAGFLIGRKNAEVSKVLVALDVTEAVVDEAIKEGAQLIVSHHPVIFRPIKSITDEKFLRLAENRIAVISMHTNLDIAEGGVNDVLLSLLGAVREDFLDEENCGRVGTLPEALSLTDFLQLCRERLHTNGLRYYDASRPVRRIAVLGGAGAGEIRSAAAKGCDTYVTSDIKYHDFQLAAELRINLIDGDHFGTEDPMIPVLCEKLAERFPELSFKVSEAHKALISFY